MYRLSCRGWGEKKAGLRKEGKGLALFGSLRSLIHFLFVLPHLGVCSQANTIKEKSLRFISHQNHFYIQAIPRVALTSSHHRGTKTHKPTRKSRTTQDRNIFRFSRGHFPFHRTLVLGFELELACSGGQWRPVEANAGKSFM